MSIDNELNTDNTNDELQTLKSAARRALDTILPAEVVEINNRYGGLFFIDSHRWSRTIDLFKQTPEYEEYIRIQKIIAEWKTSKQALDSINEFSTSRNVPESFLSSLSTELNQISLPLFRLEI